MSETTATKKYLLQSFSWIALAYLAALGAATWVILSPGQNHPIVHTFAADIAATLIIFVAGRIFRNASFYDPYWSLAPIVMASYWAFSFNSRQDIDWSQLLVLALVIIWGLRLTFNWAVQWQGRDHEDWRYVEYRRTTGKLFWLIELVGIELVPTVVVFLGCLSVYLVMTTDPPAFGPMQFLAAVVTLCAIIIESTADAQLKRFTDNKFASGRIMNSGLWKYSRHPNYLGEILFWWGLWLFIPVSASGRWLALAGPLAITSLFVFVSIPLMEKRNLARRAGYALHASKVALLVPWFPRK